MSVIPAEFLARLRLIQSPAHFQQTVDSFECHKHVTFRVQRLQADPSVVWKSLDEEGIPFVLVDWLPATAYASAEYRERIVQGRWSSTGVLFVQSLSSMLAAHLLGACPQHAVLDLAAAPGGKCTLLADCMQNTGSLAAVEVVRARMFKLQRLLKDFGVTNARTYLKDGREVGTKTPNRFDRVLLDAPCTGESRFHKTRPEAWTFWSLRKIREQSRKQAGLIRSAFRALKPGGRLLYCTCSFSPEENEQIVDSLLRFSPDEAELLDLVMPGTPSANALGHPVMTPGLTQWNGKRFDDRLQRTRRIIPDEAYDGFFLALITKTK